MAESILTESERADLRRFSVTVAERLTPQQNHSTQNYPIGKSVDNILSDAEKIFNYLTK